jgi:hypothetical protein
LQKLILAPSFCSFAHRNFDFRPSVENSAGGDEVKDLVMGISDRGQAMQFAMQQRGTGTCGTHLRISQRPG